MKQQTEDSVFPVIHADFSQLEGQGQLKTLSRDMYISGNIHLNRMQ